MYVVENVLFWDNIINLSQYNIPQSTKMLVAETKKFYRDVLPLLSESRGLLCSLVRPTLVLQILISQIVQMDVKQILFNKIKVI